jgi:hypothetical protein
MIYAGFFSISPLPRRSRASRSSKHLQYLKMLKGTLLQENLSNSAGRVVGIS